MIRVFKSRIIRELLSDEELDGLVSDFKQYKGYGLLPKNFGRNVPYNHSNTLPLVKAEQVQHIHLGNEDVPLPINKIQFYRTSDVHLVYCQSALNDDHYLLMTILSPDAHEQARTRDIMYKLGKMAEAFRNQY